MPGFLVPSQNVCDFYLNFHNFDSIKSIQTSLDANFNEQ